MYKSQFLKNLWNSLFLFLNLYCLFVDSSLPFRFCFLILTSNCARTSTWEKSWAFLNRSMSRSGAILLLSATTLETVRKVGNEGLCKNLRLLALKCRTRQLNNFFCWLELSIFRIRTIQGLFRTIKPASSANESSSMLLLRWLEIWLYLDCCDGRRLVDQLLWISENVKFAFDIFQEKLKHFHVSTSPEI